MLKVESFWVRDWEKILCWAMAVIFVLVLAGWLVGVGQEHIGGVVAKPAPLQVSFLNRAAAFAFKEEIVPPVLRDPQPFFFRVDRPRPWHPPPPPEANTQQATIVKTVIQQTAVVAKPPPRPAARTLVYLGSMKLPSGKLVAMIRDDASKSTDVAEAGGKANGLQVKSFNAQELQAVDAAGKPVQLLFKQPVNVPLE